MNGPKIHSLLVVESPMTVQRSVFTENVLEALRSSSSRKELTFRIHPKELALKVSVEEFAL